MANMHFIGAKNGPQSSSISTRRARGRRTAIDTVSIDVMLVIPSKPVAVSYTNRNQLEPRKFPVFVLWFTFATELQRRKPAIPNIYER